jgi:hypothetical protein
MGYRDPIVGRVQTVTRGISVSNAAPSTQGLPNVDPVYTWVRLAQRVPVRIRITDVPAGVPLVSGMTATVTIPHSEARESGGWRQRFASLANRLGDIVRGPQASPGCIPRIGDENGATVTLPTPKPVAPLNPEELNPGVAPGLNKPPPSLGLRPLSDNSGYSQTAPRRSSDANDPKRIVQPARSRASD